MTSGENILPYYRDPWLEVWWGDCRDVLSRLQSESVHTVVTSPPYWGLRDYGTATWKGGDENCDHRPPDEAGSTRKPTAGQREHAGRFAGPSCWRCGAVRQDNQLGLEPTPEAYIAAMVDVFREVRRVLRKDGTLWLNMGDNYNANVGAGFNGQKRQDHANRHTVMPRPAWLKPKDLVGIPWRLAFALQADGWYLRSDIIWCLSGGARVYARTQKGDIPMTVHDLVRLRPETVQLWNGWRWTQALGWSQATDREAVEVEVRSGERIGCTPHHEWPTLRGMVPATDLLVGDVVETTRLPQPSNSARAALDDEMTGWLVGLYIAEGSRSGDTLQFAGHINDPERFRRLADTAEAFDGTVRVHQTSPNGVTANINGPIIDGIVHAYVAGHDAHTKHLTTRAWQRSDAFLHAVLDGYLAGDGHYDATNDRWRLGFTANDALAADLRTLGARVGSSVRIRRSAMGWRGEVRHSRSDHPNNRHDGEVVAIRRSRGRRFWHIGVANAPHLFALASGLLTGNSKPNPMPESVTDRPTKAHEYLFLLTKSARYFYDAEAVREPHAEPWRGNGRHESSTPHNGRLDGGEQAAFTVPKREYNPAGRNLRSVWTIATQPYPGAHYATFPEALVEPCIKAGTSERGVCPECGAPWMRETQPSESRMAAAGITGKEVFTTGWRRSCTHEAEPIPATVLDPFAGSGTTGLVANRLGRRAILIDLSAEYLDQALTRNQQKPLGLGA